MGPRFCSNLKDVGWIQGIDATVRWVGDDDVFQIHCFVSILDQSTIWLSIFACQGWSLSPRSNWNIGQVPGGALKSFVVVPWFKQCHAGIDLDNAAFAEMPWQSWTIFHSFSFQIHYGCCQRFDSTAPGSTKDHPGCGGDWHVGNMRPVH